MADPNRRPLQALVLNTDFRPLSTWPLSLIDCRDAVHAVFRQRVDVIESWPGEFFRSPSTVMAAPKIVALRQYAPIHGEPKFSRRSILLRDRFCCQYCGRKLPSEELTLDHVVPRSAGGKTVWTNILTACLRCNALKGSQPANYGGRKAVPGSVRPLKEPRRPTAAELMRAGVECLAAHISEDFGSWLYWNTALES